MANRLAHCAIAATVVGGVLIATERDKGEHHAPLRIIGPGLAALLADLPDRIEPASCPQHRQFFHSVMWAALVGYLMLRVHEWEPEEMWEELVRFFLLIAGGAYLVHLAVDALSPSSIPLLGKI